MPHKKTKLPVPRGNRSGRPLDGNAPDSRTARQANGVGPVKARPKGSGAPPGGNAEHMRKGGPRNTSGLLHDTGGSRGRSAVARRPNKPHKSKR